MCVSLSVIIAAPLTRFGCTIGDSEPLAHPLTSSLAPVTHSLAPDCSLHTARFARLLTHSLPSSWDNGIFLSNFQCVLNHSGMTLKSTHRVLGHSLVRSLVHRTFIRCLRTTRFRFRFRCAHSFVRSLAHSLAPEPMGKRFLSLN